MSFADITEEVYSLDYEEQLELKTLLEKYLIENRREELLSQHQEAIRMAIAGELVFTDNTEDLVNMLGN